MCFLRPACCRQARKTPAGEPIRGAHGVGGPVQFGAGAGGSSPAKEPRKNPKPSNQRITCTVGLGSLLNGLVWLVEVWGRVSPSP